MGKATSDIYALRTDCPKGRESCRSAGSARPASSEEEKEQQQSVDPIYCRNCGGVVSDKSQKTAVQDSHRHTFFNPAGIVYELGCFKEAPGSYSAGELTSQFSWFAGYLWRFAMCSHCNSHLGWLYQSGDSSFLGLILAELRE